MQWKTREFLRPPNVSKLVQDVAVGGLGSVTRLGAGLHVKVLLGPGKDWLANPEEEDAVGLRT